MDTARLALLVDIWPSDDNELRVIVPQRSAAYEPYFELLGPLDTQLRLGRMFGWLPAAGLKVNDLDHYAWRSDETPLKVVADATVFADKALRWPPAARRVRVEVPTVSPPSPAHSIVDSDRLALLLEWIAGLEIGLVAVNRDPTARKIRLPWRETRGEGRLISTQGKAVVLQAAELARLSQSGLRLSPGATLVVERGNSE